jgi:hypothetical protein
MEALKYKKLLALKEEKKVAQSVLMVLNGDEGGRALRSRTPSARLYFNHHRLFCLEFGIFLLALRDAGDAVGR